jgi:hypothetical protein
VGNHQFSPTCELGGPFFEGMGYHIFSSFFTSISQLPFIKYYFWNVVDPFDLSDSFGQGS